MPDISTGCKLTQELFNSLACAFEQETVNTSGVQLIQIVRSKNLIEIRRFGLKETFELVGARMKQKFEENPFSNKFVCVAWAIALHGIATQNKVSIPHPEQYCQTMQWVEWVGKYLKHLK